MIPDASEFRLSLSLPFPYRISRALPLSPRNLKVGSFNRLNILSSDFLREARGNCPSGYVFMIAINLAIMEDHGT